MSQQQAVPRPATHHFVIGTAGHIDHGKTSLVKALTGIDTDRLKEEKERGITIELGFAYLALERHGTVGVVDVPGHERFIRTMVAGAVGIDLVVLVVAADEGVMPQTREHLDICGLLGIRGGLVALTKADLVDAEMLELAQEDVRAALEGTFLASAPILPCSALTGAGLTELRAAIDRLLDEVPGKDPGGVLRLPVDRVFTMKGFGTVATGTLIAGQLQVGDELVPLPGSGSGVAPAKVRGIHVHGHPVERAFAGQRTAVNLGLPRESLLRGETLVRPGSIEASQEVDVRLFCLPAARAPLPRRAKVLLHAGTTQRLAQVRLLDCGEVQPGGQALAQVHLAQPLTLQPGDRFILRGFALQKNHSTTLGGGTVLRTRSARQRRGKTELLETLKRVERALAGLPSGESETGLLALEIERSGVAGRSLRELLMRLPLPEKRLLSALSRLGPDRLVGLGGQEPVYVGRKALLLVRDAVLGAVRAHHRHEPRAPGLGREALQLQIGPVGGDRDGVGEGRPQLCPPRLLQRAVEGLVKEGQLVLEREVLRLPGHDPAQAAEDISAFAERVRALYREGGLAPLRPEEAAAALGVPLPRIRDALDLLLQRQAVLRVKDLFFDQESVAALRQRLVAFLKQHGQLTPQQWKDLCGTSRKFSIPLAEYFDAEKLTLRVGDLRRLRGA